MIELFPFTDEFKAFETRKRAEGSKEVLYPFDMCLDCEGEGQDGSWFNNDKEVCQSCLGSGMFQPIKLMRIA